MMRIERPVPAQRLALPERRNHSAPRAPHITLIVNCVLPPAPSLPAGVSAEARTGFFAQVIGHVLPEGALDRRQAYPVLAQSARTRHLCRA